MLTRPVVEASAGVGLLDVSVTNCGGEFSTVRENDTTCVFPLLSVAVIDTDVGELRSSTVSRYHDHEPFAFFATVPTDADSGTVSNAAPLQVPELVARWPSVTVTALSTDTPSAPDASAATSESLRAP